jgi:hypothetical protein
MPSPLPQFALVDFGSNVVGVADAARNDREWSDVRENVQPANLSVAATRARLFDGSSKGRGSRVGVESLQQRAEHWVIADMIGKGDHVRTVPVPTWVKAAVDNWMTAAGVTVGPIFRPPRPCLKRS